VEGPITWAPSGAPSADSSLTPFVEVWTNVTGAAQAFTLSLSVYDPTGALVGSVTGSGSVEAGNTTTWTPEAPVALPSASLWHLVAPPLSPALYQLVTVLSVNGG
jgi:hypothetical protein